MDFYYFYSWFLSFVDYLRKKILFVILFFIFILLLCLYFYTSYSFEVKSSELFTKLVNGTSSEFLEKKQSGIYEDIRRSLLEKDSKNKVALSKLEKKHDVFAKYFKFVKQMDGVFGDEFDSILEAEGSTFRNLFISSKVFYGKYSDEMKNIPFFLNVYVQYKKGVIK